MATNFSVQPVTVVTLLLPTEWCALSGKTWTILRSNPRRLLLIIWRNFLLVADKEEEFNVQMELFMLMWNKLTFGVFGVPSTKIRIIPMATMKQLHSYFPLGAPFLFLLCYTTQCFLRISMATRPMAHIMHTGMCMWAWHHHRHRSI